MNQQGTAGSTKGHMPFSKKPTPPYGGGSRYEQDLVQLVQSIRCCRRTKGQKLKFTTEQGSPCCEPTSSTRASTEVTSRENFSLHH